MKNVREEQKRLLEHFWNVWRQEYLTTFMQRKKWVDQKAPLQIGQMLVIQNENLPVTKWELGRIIKLIPSHDNIMRSVLIRTPKHVIKRPIQKLCILPVESEVARPIKLPILNANNIASHDEMK